LRHKLIGLILLLIFLTGTAFGASILTLDEFIQTAVENNPSYQISAEDYLIALQENKSAKSLEDWNLIASSYWQESVPAPTSGFSSTYQQTVGYSLGLSKYIAGTGTAIQLEYGGTQVRANYPNIIIPGIGSIFPTSPYYVSSVSLTISQPLLKNAFGLATKNALKMSDYSLKIAKIKLSEDWEDFVATLIDEYKEWQNCVLNVKVYKNKLKSVEGQLALVNRQLKYGLSEKLDVVQIKQKEKAYNLLLEQAKMRCESQTEKILGCLNQAKADPVDISPEEFIQNGSVLPETEAKTYLENQSNIRQTADILVAIQKANLETQENAEQADLNLILQATPNAYSQGTNDTLQELGTYRDYSATISYSRPLGNDQAKADAKKARAEYEQALKIKESTMINSKVGLTGLYIGLRHLDEMLKLNKENLALAKEVLVLEKNKFEQGRNSIFFVLQAEDSLLEAENNLNSTLFAQEKIINQIKALTDRYMVEYKEILKL